MAAVIVSKVCVLVRTSLLIPLPHLAGPQPASAASEGLLLQTG